MGQLVLQRPELPDQGIGPERRVTGRCGCAGRPGIGPAGNLRDGVGDARVEPVEPLPRIREGRGRRVEGGLQFPLQVNKQGRRRGPANGIGERSSVSPNPSKQRESMIRSSASARSPDRKVMRWPARFPLSTAET